jgi:hypothetical protein
VTISLVIAIITMITSNQPPIYGSPTTEDDGWVEGDYEGSSEEQEEQAQEDWEDAGRPGEMDNDNDENDNENDNDNNDELIECKDGTLVETEELCEQSGALVQCTDGSYAATLDECPPEPIVTEIDCPDGSIGTIQDGCPPVAETLPPCDGSFQDCITLNGDICKAGSSAHECEIEEPIETSLGVQCSDGTSVKTLAECKSTIPPNSAYAPGFQATSGPDNDCLFSPELLKCAADTNGDCPDGFGTNEDGQCFVIHDKCPDGYHGHEDDESGKCISNDIQCETGYEMAVMTNGGDNCEQKQKPISCRDVPFYMTCDNQKKRNENKESSGDKISHSMVLLFKSCAENQVTLTQIVSVTAR